MARGDNFKGKRPANSGRKKGVANKTTQDLREMIRAALDDAGGRNYLQMQALENPGPFMALIGKIIPQEVRQEITGKDGGPIQTQGVPRVSKREWLVLHGLGTPEGTAD